MRKRTPKKSLPKLTERQFQRQIIQLAHACGWRVAHFRAARKKDGTWRTPVEADGKGWPDLVLVHAKRRLILYRELKTDTGKPTAEQLVWIQSLVDAGCNVAIWRPHDWPYIQDILAGK